jgi:hypothetical protein
MANFTIHGYGADLVHYTVTSDTVHGGVSEGTDLAGIFEWLRGKMAPGDTIAWCVR